jgi:predicted nucleic acid-binding protein
LSKIVIADTSCLISLSRVGALYILPKLFNSIVITKEVSIEFGDDVPEWINIQNTTNLSLLQELNRTLDIGESSAICLAFERNALLIIDEKKGRNRAKELGIDIIGTLGVLILAKRKGVIKEIKPLLEDLKSAGIWIHPSIFSEVLSEANET